MDSELPEESVSPLEKFKIPLIAGSLGLLLILVGVRVLISNSASPVEFVENTASSSAQTELVVDVAGAVEKPGLYKLHPEARIQDALLSAGGLATDADREWVAKHLNLAAKMTDGAKVYIPTLSEVVSVAKTPVLGTASTTSVDIISINSASEVALESLPGVGDVTAQKIITQRPYTSLEELLNKKVVNKSTFEKIKDKISL